LNFLDVVELKLSYLAMFERETFKGGCCLYGIMKLEKHPSTSKKEKRPKIILPLGIEHKQNIFSQDRKRFFFI